MSAFDFDTIIDRHETHSAKWDALAAATGVTAADGLAMWVADMDFQACPAVRGVLRAEVERGVHGYYANDRTWRSAMVDWMAKRHGWTVDPDWITVTPGLVSGCGLVLQALTNPGDGVVLFTPVYHAFHKIIAANDRIIIQSPMTEVQGRYRMDLETLDRTLPDNARIVFFCSPHNPGGTVWSADEIRALAAFCAHRDLLLVSDEIHHDLVYPGFRHRVTHTVAPEHADRLITAAAASKTFNIAGAHVGGVIISNPDLRAKLHKVVAAAGLMSHNLFGMIATEAAYAHGEPWLEALIPYLAGNRDLLDARIAADIPGARSMPLESTYLSWVDFAGTGLDGDEVMRRIRDVARIGASPGPQFGIGGETRVRFNIATPRARVTEAMDRLADAFADLR